MDECKHSVVMNGHSFCELRPVLQSYQVVTTSSDSFLRSSLPLHMTSAADMSSKKLNQEDFFYEQFNMRMTQNTVYIGKLPNIYSCNSLYGANSMFTSSLTMY
jgi:hypothetical protein